MFITFEGVEGSGKSTLMTAIDRVLRAQGRRTLLTREPGGTPAGDAVRDIVLNKPDLRIDAMTEMLLMNASRAQLVAEVIRPALERGDVVLCDRYVDSSLAYQGYGRGLPLEIVRGVCSAATGGLMPDLTLLLDVSPETSHARLCARGNGRDRLESENAAFHRRIREGFLEIGRREPRFVVLDGERSQEQVVDAALAALTEAMQ